MILNTKIDIEPSDNKINHLSKMISLGSCFSENIGKKLENLYFDIDVNPFGTLYNPISIAQSLERLISGQKFVEYDLFEYKSLYHSFLHDSFFSAASVDDTLNKINTRFTQAAESLKNADFVLITFGSAWCFVNAQSGRVVSNCHKLPADNFTRKRLTVDEIVARYADLLFMLLQTNKDLKIIFSVSPVRYWQDGAHGNMLSKSTLLLAIDALQNKFSNVSYFPAYEIVMDELRDYGFYADDMFHLSDRAIEYIFERFTNTYFDNTTLEIVKKAEQINADNNHKPLNTQSSEYQTFIQQKEKRLNDFIEKYPFLADRIKRS